MIDELNNLVKYNNKIDDVDAWMDDFFGVMEIDDEQKEKRKKVAFSIRESMLFLFSLMFTMAEASAWSYEVALDSFRNEFRNAISQYFVIDAFLENYIQDFTRKYLDITIEHLSKADASFFVSDDRATIGSANESNSVVGYEELEEAKEDGYTMKRWRTQRDERVRKTHREVEGKTIPIDDYFVVGDSLLYYPGDPEGSEEEIAGCRCVCEYL